MQKRDDYFMFCFKVYGYRFLYVCKYFYIFAPNSNCFLYFVFVVAERISVFMIQCCCCYWWCHCCWWYNNVFICYFLHLKRIHTNDSIFISRFWAVWKIISESSQSLAHALHSFSIVIRTIIVCFDIYSGFVCWKCSQWFLYFSITLFLFPVVMFKHKLHRKKWCS